MVPFTIGILFARGICRFPRNSFLYTNFSKHYYLYKSIVFIICKIRSSPILRMFSFINLCVLLFVTLLLFERNFYLWSLISFPIILTTILMTKLCHKCFCKYWEKIGSISNLLFIIHPIIREFPLAFRENMTNHPYMYLMLYLICTFIMVTPFRHLLNTIDRIETKVFR